MLLRLFFRPKKNHPPVRKERVSVADHRSVHGLRNHVVGKQDVVTALPVVEYKEGILSIRARDTTLKAHVGEVRLEDFRLTGEKQIPVRENDPLLIWQQNTGMPNGIDTMHRLGLLIKDEIAIEFFPVRKNLQQNQRPNNSIENLGIIERLISFSNWLFINPGSGLGVIFNLDGEIASHRFDKDPIFNRNMRMLARTLHITMRPFPLKFLLRRKLVFMVEAVPNILEGAVPLHKPLKGLEVGDRFSDPKPHVEVRSDHHEFHKDRLTIVFVEIFKIVQEGRVGEGFLNGNRREGVRFLIVVVDIKDVFDRGRGLKPKLDIVSEEKAVVPDRDDIARNTAMFG